MIKRNKFSPRKLMRFTSSWFFSELSDSHGQNLPLYLAHFNSVAYRQGQRSTGISVVKLLRARLPVLRGGSVPLIACWPLAGELSVLSNALSHSEMPVHTHHALSNLGPHLAMSAALFSTANKPFVKNFTNFLLELRWRVYTTTYQSISVFLGSPFWSLAHISIFSFKLPTF